MAKRTITEGDVEAVLAAPTKELPGDDGCVNVLGLWAESKTHPRDARSDAHGHRHRRQR
jgi:hypothetical protein